MTAIRTADPHYVFARYVSAMPGGEYIQDAWRDEPYELVLVTLHDRYECEKRRALTSVTDSFPSPGQEPETNELWLYVPQLASRILHWEADEYLWGAETFSIAEHYSELRHIEGRDLCVLLGQLTPHLVANGMDGADALDLLHQIVIASQAHTPAQDYRDVFRAAVSLLSQGYLLEDIPQLACALNTTTVASP